MSINIFDLSQTYQKENSKKILSRIFDLPDEEVDRDALEIILYATEKGIHCKETAKNIVFIIEESQRINEDMFHIIRGLSIGDYFHATPEISSLISKYLDRNENQFDTNEDLELHSELIQDSIKAFVEENPS